MLLSQARESDAQLLRTLSVRMICDLMVEMVTKLVNGDEWVIGDYVLW